MWVSHLLQLLARTLVGAYPRWVGSHPNNNQRIYIANHTSHIDTIAIWAALPENLQKHTHTVAAWDYWANNKFKRWLTTNGLNAVYIKRNKSDNHGEDPLQPLYDTLEKGESLIIFPEGTRNKSDIPQPFKSGIYYLAKRFPQVEFIPVYLENLSRIMPKGEFWPVPLACTARFGKPFYLEEGEEKDHFLERARQGVIDARSTHVATN